MKDKDKRFEGLGTKIDPAMYEVLDKCCNVLRVDVYHLLQWFAYTIIRAASPWHELDPRIQKLLAMLESDAGWQVAFNIANPGKLKVAQAILILEQEGRKGFGAVMVDKPWMGKETRQTECVDDILERVTEVTMHGIYRRLRNMGGMMKCQNLSDVLLTMIDEQTMIEHDKGFRAELPGMGDYNYNGKQVAYGKKTKAKQHRSPDSYAQDQRIKQQTITFDDYDREVASKEADGWTSDNADKEDIEKRMGFSPHGDTW